ncbi:enoyl-CoA hydratase/isomerase family protein [Streptomyces pratensis]|uniref:enoyl-CoA hydratase/isomerase family protein n=1 Tax=Streptomyces pratensis TaxID=1169025 RepID=UPI0030167009
MSAEAFPTAGAPRAEETGPAGREWVGAATETFADFADRVDGRRDVPLRARFDCGVATLTLDRPHRRNSLDLTLSRHLLLGLMCAGDDPRVRTVVVTGSGGAFCAGDDVDSVGRWRSGDRGDTPFDPITSDAHYLRVCEAMLHLPKPVVAGLTGAAAGAGAEIACAADFRLADTRASIGSCLAGVGHVGNVVLMSRLAGPARATEIYLTGRMVSGAEAVRLGLFDRLCEPGDFERELGELAGRFAALPTASVGLFKELRERSWGQPAEYGLRLQDAYHLKTHATVADAREGMAAFAEKRRPRFTGG